MPKEKRAAIIDHLERHGATRKRLFRSLGKIYDTWHRKGKTITPEVLTKEWETRNGVVKE